MICLRQIADGRIMVVASKDGVTINMFMHITGKGDNEWFPLSPERRMIHERDRETGIFTKNGCADQ